MPGDATTLNPMFAVLSGNAVAAGTTLQRESVLGAAKDIMSDQLVGNFLEGGVLPPAPNRGGHGR